MTRMDPLETLASIDVPPSRMVQTVAEAHAAASEILAGGAKLLVVKAQVHAGGRGKGHFKNDPGGKGGVRIAKSADDVGAHAAAMLGQDLVTKQTGAEGRRVDRVYLMERLYLRPIA
jgi:succinyl-CoA synthetase beta subunit